jgi:hypothetical protein
LSSNPEKLIRKNKSGKLNPEKNKPGIEKSGIEKIRRKKNLEKVKSGKIYS